MHEVTPAEETKIEGLVDSGVFSYFDARLRVTGIPEEPQAEAIASRLAEEDRPQTEEGVGYPGGVPYYLQPRPKLTGAERVSLKNGIAACRAAVIASTKKSDEI